VFYSSRAPPRPPSKTISVNPSASVRLLNEGRPTIDPVLTRVVETLAGRPLTMSEVRQTVTHLFSLARFEDVRVDAELENGRVALRYELSPIHPVSKIRFTGGEGKAGIDGDDLRRAIVERYGGSPPLGRLSDMTRLLAELLRERGYLHASITPRSDIEHEPERAVLVFTLDAGSRTVIGDVDIVGQPTAERSELLARLGLRPGSPVSAERAQRAHRSLCRATARQPLLRSEGAGRRPARR
jgi:outer membrane protein assembly factor BamA